MKVDLEKIVKIIEGAVSALDGQSWEAFDDGSDRPELFEIEVASKLKASAESLGYDVQVKHIGGRRFPDIIFQGTRYGVEVKTAKKGWKCLGNSVNASTQVEGIDQIFLIFGSGTKYIKVRYSRYEDSVHEVSVTHSPRYGLDMDTQRGESYFSKIGMSMEEILRHPKPINVILEQARKALKPGESLWWVSDDTSAPLSIKNWKSLPLDLRKKYIASAFVFFPEVIAQPRAHYDNFVAWLVSRHSVIVPNVRDLFSAGGTGEFVTDAGTIKNAPRVLLEVFDSRDLIKQAVANCSAFEWVSTHGGLEKDYDKPNARFIKWASIVRPYLKAKARRAKGVDPKFADACVDAFLKSFVV